MRRLRPLVVAAVLALGCGGGDPDGRAPATDTDPSAAAPPDRGRLTGRAPEAVGGVPSVVSLIPESPSGPPPSDTVRVDQAAMAFAPDRALVRVGQTVRFENSEMISHNVHVRSTATDETLLNVDMDMGGEADLTLPDPGAYEVLCEFHPGMTAFLYATETPYAVFAEDDGGFAFEGVPPGTYRMVIWSADEERRSEREVEVGEGVDSVF